MNKTEEAEKNLADFRTKRFKIARRILKCLESSKGKTGPEIIEAKKKCLNCPDFPLCRKTQEIYFG
jgi:hypothetical protein